MKIKTTKVRCDGRVVNPSLEYEEFDSLQEAIDNKGEEYVLGAFNVQHKTFIMNEERQKHTIKPMSMDRARQEASAYLGKITADPNHADYQTIMDRLTSGEMASVIEETAKAIKEQADKKADEVREFQENSETTDVDDEG